MKNTLMSAQACPLAKQAMKLTVARCQQLLPRRRFLGRPATAERRSSCPSRQGRRSPKLLPRTMNEEAVSAFRALAYDPYDCSARSSARRSRAVSTDEPRT